MRDFLTADFRNSRGRLRQSAAGLLLGLLLLLPKADDPRQRNDLAMIVREQVDAFRKRQADNDMLRALTERQIDEAVERGKVTMGNSDVPVQAVDEEAAIGAAWQAFEDGLYLVVIDEVEQRQLDAEVHLNEESRITFLRLTLLAGG